MKKYFAMFLVVGLMLTIFSPIAHAYSQVEYFCENGFSDMFIPGIDNELSGSAKVDYYSSSGFDYVDYNAYTLLNEKQMKVFNAIKNSSIGTMSVTVNYSGTEMKKSELTQDFLTEIMYAVCYDLPQFFYHAGYSASYSYTSSGYITKIIYNFALFKATVNSRNVVPTYTSSTLISCWNKLESVLNNLDFDTSNRYNFIKNVHDYLCNTIIYPDLSSSYYVGDCHDAYGALVNGYAVCQGYAESFKLICDYYKIPCVYISGTADGGGHAWNAIQMDDGKWYFIDSTWDDQTSRIYYDFFLVGTQTTNTYFGGAEFSQEHVNDVDLFLPGLNYSTNAYNKTQNHNTGFKATYNSAADFDDNYLYLSAFDAGKSYVYYNGIYVPVNSFSNNIKFNAPSGLNSGSEEWTIILLGDLNSDDICNEMDYSASINLWKTTDNVIDTTEERSCDVNLDGVIDVLDLAIIARASTGVNTNIILE